MVGSRQIVTRDAASIFFQSREPATVSKNSLAVRSRPLMISRTSSLKLAKLRRMRCGRDAAAVAATAAAVPLPVAPPLIPALMLLSSFAVFGAATLATAPASEHSDAPNANQPLAIFKQNSQSPKRRGY